MLSHPSPAFEARSAVSTLPSASIAHSRKEPWFRRLARIGAGGLRNRLNYKAYRIIVRSLTLFGMRHLLLGQPFSAEKHRLTLSTFKLLHPAEVLDFADPAAGFEADPFLRSCQDIVKGRLRRASIFTCEVPAAKFSPENGLVFDMGFRCIVESILDVRRFYTFRKTFRPRSLTRRSGTFSSVQHPWHFNNWHWTADSLPQIRSLAVHMEGRPLTLLMSNEVGRVHRDSLEAILPENFTVEYVNPSEWFELQCFVLPSHVSSRANACFPPEYYEFIRSRTFAKLGIAKPDAPAGRYYISRGRAKHRRVLNEAATAALLAEFGFQHIFIEDYTFAQQVELFRNSQAIVSPHGAALGGILYGEDLQVCVLYPEARPAGYFYTLARGLGHRHFCVNADLREDDDFTVDLATLRRVLTEEMRLG